MGSVSSGAKSLGSTIAGSSIGGLMGQKGGAAGTGFSAPQGVNLQQPVTLEDAKNAQGSVNASLNSQRALLSALQGQNGLGQQNAVAQQQQALNNQLNAANGIGTQNSAIQGLQGAAGMYQNIAAGQGPNVARSMLNQQTGQNVANQAALMAGQRGAGANVGLMARQAAQQGANTQQQAVGQGATMQAQQQQAALAGLTNAQQAVGGLGTSQLAAQQAQQQALANQANVVAGQQIAGTTTATQADMANAAQLQGNLGNYNNAMVGSQNNINAANAGLANTSMQGSQKMIGGALNSGIGGLMGARGGNVKKMALGGDSDDSANATLMQGLKGSDSGNSSSGIASLAPLAMMAMANGGPVSSFGQFLAGWGNGNAGASPIQESDPNLSRGVSALDYDPTQPKKKKPIDTGTEIAAGVDTGNTDAISGASQMPGSGSSNELSGVTTGLSARGGLANKGGHVAAKKDSQKAVKKGNSYSNDKIPAMLSQGEIVLPRSVTQSADPIKNSADFVRKVLAKRKSK